MQWSSCTQQPPKGFEGGEASFSPWAPSHYAEGRTRSVYGFLTSWTGCTWLSPLLHSKWCLMATPVPQALHLLEEAAQQSSKDMRCGKRRSWILILALPLISCMTAGNLFNLHFMPQFSHPQDEVSTAHTAELLWVWLMKWDLSECLARRRHSISVCVVSWGQTKSLPTEGWNYVQDLAWCHCNFLSRGYRTRQISLPICMCVIGIEGTEHNSKYKSPKSTPVLLLEA